jgi:hypothetical protein
MLLPVIALVLGSTIAVHLEEGEDLPLETQLGVARALVGAIEARSGRAAVLDDPSWPPCEPTPACAATIAARSGASSTLFLRVISGPTLIRVVVHQGEAELIYADVSSDGEAWPQTLGDLSVRLFGAGTLVRRPELLGAAPEAPRRIWPWALLAGSAVALGAGISLGVLSQQTQDEVAGRHALGSATDAARDRKSSQAWAANILFLAAGALGLSGLGVLTWGD